MIVREPANVLEVRPWSPGASELRVEMEGGEARALAYHDLVGPVSPGDRVLLNTTAVRLGLGTGGLHLVIATNRAGQIATPDAHTMKMRYAPNQTALPVVEETHRDVVDAVGDLGAMRVIAAGLHSAVAPIVLAARATEPRSRIVYIQTDAAALPLAFSRTIPALVYEGLIERTITAGQAFGGDLEAVTLHGALAAAHAVAGADIAVVSMGPGNLGTASRWGFAGLEVGTIVNAAASLGASPIAAARVSFADERERHRGVSHHTLTALATVALAAARIPVPSYAPDRERMVLDALRPLCPPHEIVPADLGPAEEALARSPVPLRTMGRTYEEDPDAFRTAAAAGVLAATR